MTKSTPNINTSVRVRVDSRLETCAYYLPIPLSRFSGPFRYTYPFHVPLLCPLDNVYLIGLRRQRLVSLQHLCKKPRGKIRKKPGKRLLRPQLEALVVAGVSQCFKNPKTCNTEQRKTFEKRLILVFTLWEILANWYCINI